MYGKDKNSRQITKTTTVKSYDEWIKHMRILGVLNILTLTTMKFSVTSLRVSILIDFFPMSSHKTVKSNDDVLLVEKEV